MKTRTRVLVAGVALSVLLSASHLYGSGLGFGKMNDNRRRIRIGAEYFFPTEEDRNIRTANWSAYFPIESLKTGNLSTYAGITATYAYGDITQLEGDFNQGTLREVNYENEAFGIGPGILADLRIWRTAGFSLHVDASGSLIFYNEDFPAGGERYNFMWRAGPGIKLGRHLGITYQWMHVSNGQGLGPKNPSYDAQGITLQYSF